MIPLPSLCVILALPALYGAAAHVMPDRASIYSIFFSLVTMPYLSGLESALSGLVIPDFQALELE
jgi:hypothetical protein